MRKKQIHALKCLNPHYFLLTTGQKTFEIRKADMDFQVGDILHLEEYRQVYPDVENVGAYTGESIYRQITHILDGEKWGIMPGYVVMSLSPYIQN
jgi:hypothetical protein